MFGPQAYYYVLQQPALPGLYEYLQYNIQVGLKQRFPLY